MMFSGLINENIKMVHIKIVCSNCHCDINKYELKFSQGLCGPALGLPYMINISHDFPKYLTMFVICKSCIKDRKYQKKLMLLENICILHNKLQQKMKNFNQSIIENFFQSNIKINKDFFDELIPKHELEGFVVANRKNTERFKKKSKFFLSVKLNNVINDYLNDSHEIMVLDEQINNYKKSLKENRILPKKGNNKITTCEEAEFYDLIEEVNSEFLPLEFNITILKDQIKEVLVQKFNLIYLNKEPLDRL